VTDLQTRFVQFARKRALIRKHDHVMVALSGGVDSVVLLHLLKDSAEQLQIDLSAAHFDHAMRANSAEDAAWVAGLCTAWNIPLIRERATRPIYGETDARIERYRFLMAAMKQADANRIATGHQADDQVETVLFRLMRGTGLRGLAGIPIRRGVFIRPLLRFTKQELIAYAAAHDLNFRADATNEELNYARNRIRRNVLPALETVAPEARASILKMARHAARTEALWHWVLQHLDEEIVTAKDKRSVELARPKLLEYHPELRARIIRHYLRRFGVVPSAANTKNLVEFCENADSGSAVDVSGRVRVERAFDRIRIERAAFAAIDEQGVLIVGDQGSARLNIGDRMYDVEWKVDDVRRTGAEHFDAALLDQNLELRGWRKGDRIRLGYGTKKLKKLFAERRIPASQRASVPVLTDQSGRVLWVPGVARSVDAHEDGKRILNLMVKHAEIR
jgi:tRNA(Ile)-lysidine synthase